MQNCKGSNHIFVNYMGLSESYNYCTVCGIKESQDKQEDPTLFNIRRMCYDKLLQEQMSIIQKITDEISVPKIKLTGLSAWLSDCQAAPPEGWWKEGKLEGLKFNDKGNIVPVPRIETYKMMQVPKIYAIPKVTLRGLSAWLPDYVIDTKKLTYTNILERIMAEGYSKIMSNGPDSFNVLYISCHNYSDLLDSLGHMVEKDTFQDNYEDTLFLHIHGIKTAIFYDRCVKDDDTFIFCKVDE